MKNWAVVIIIAVQLCRIVSRIKKDQTGLACVSVGEFLTVMWLLNEVW